MIDWVRVQDLQEEMGHENFDEVVALFLEEADAAVALLAGRLAPADLATALHALKGSALNLGFSTLAALCAEAETAAAGGGSPDIAAIPLAYGQSRRIFLDGLSADAA